MFLTLLPSMIGLFGVMQSSKAQQEQTQAQKDYIALHGEKKEKDIADTVMILLVVVVVVGLSYYIIKNMK